jgi:hypothetical protein
MPPPQGSRKYWAIHFDRYDRVEAPSSENGIVSAPQIDIIGPLLATRSHRYRQAHVGVFVLVLGSSHVASTKSSITIQSKSSKASSRRSDGKNHIQTRGRYQDRAQLRELSLSIHLQNKRLRLPGMWHAWGCTRHELSRISQDLPKVKTTWPTEKLLLGDTRREFWNGPCSCMAPR